MSDDISLINVAVRYLVPTAVEDRQDGLLLRQGGLEFLLINSFIILGDLEERGLGGFFSIKLGLVGLELLIELLLLFLAGLLVSFLVVVGSFGSLELIKNFFVVGLGDLDVLEPFQKVGKTVRGKEQVDH